MKIAIVGKEADTLNYVRYVQSVGAMPLVTLNPETAAACDALLLPGGGDVTPAFFGETNHGSRNIDTELDILQLQSLDMAVRARQPVLGICKGFQIINVKFGGTLIQDLDPERTALHGWEEGDRYHPSAIPRGSWLRGLYGETTVVNSAHHQALERLGEREKHILALRFYEGKTQMEVSAEVGISQAQVSRLEKNALKTIQKNI